MLRAQAMDSGFTWGGAVNDSLEIPRGYVRRSTGTTAGPTTPEGMEKAIAEFQRTGDFAALQYLTRKELYRRTGEKRFLVPQPEPRRPARAATASPASRRGAARNKAVYNMDYYFVGDEGSLTSYGDPVDFCWDAHTLAGFRALAADEYGSLDALNAQVADALRGLGRRAARDHRGGAGAAGASRPGPIIAPTWSARSRTPTRWSATRSCPGTRKDASPSPAPRPRRRTTAATGTGSTR